MPKNQAESTVGYAVGADHLVRAGTRSLSSAAGRRGFADEDYARWATIALSLTGVRERT